MLGGLEVASLIRARWSREARFSRTWAALVTPSESAAGPRGSHGRRRTVTAA
jgi:hypothetical protein